MSKVSSLALGWWRHSKQQAAIMLWQDGLHVLIAGPSKAARHLCAHKLL